MRKKSSKVKVAKGRSQLDEYAATDSDNELDDLFASGADRVGLTKDAKDSDDELDEEAVYNMDDEHEDESDDDVDAGDDELLDEALLKGGEAAQLAKQARYLEQKLQLQRGEDDSDRADDDDDEEQAELRDKLWGANKRAYYQTEEEGEDSDEEDLQEEEVRRLQQQQAAALADDDYDLPSAAAAAHPTDQTLEQQVSAAAAPGVQIESVSKDLSALSAEEQLAVVMADAPELISSLDELKNCLSEVRGRIAPLLREVAAGGLATAAGLSYLEAKHLLLLQYCMCIVAYLMLKAEGKSVKDHPVIARLVQLRSYIEKIRPIDKQLAYQINKLLRATSVAQAQATDDVAAADKDLDATAAAAAAAAGGVGAGGGGGDNDALRFRPNPAALIAKAPLLGDVGGLDGGTAGVYRPPKLNPVAMDEDRALSKKEERRLREAQRKAHRSSVMREIAQELVGAPEEVREELPGFDSAAAVAARQVLEARSAAEEELMLRVPLSKLETKKLKAQRRAGMSGAGLTDFADEVADIVAANTAEGAGKGNSIADLYGKHRLSQQYGADVASQQQLRSGDADIPLRQPLHQRRAVFDAVAARRSAAAGSDEDDEGLHTKKRRSEPAGEEDEFYAASKAARAEAKAAKRSKHEVPQLAPPLPDPEATGQRKISYEIEKNRGLTPHRNKDLKNPRKKHRIKFAQAVVRRKGQVQGVKQAPSAPRGYAGEATGIKAKVAKSVRL